VFDKMAIQYFLISVSNFLAILIFPFLFNKEILLKHLRHPLMIFSLGYLLMSLLSMLKSINIIESIVELGQIITYIITLYLILTLLFQKLIKINHVLFILSITLIIDIAFSLSAYFPYVYNDLMYSFDDNWKLVGLYGNRNILATTIAFRIPFLVILAIRLKKYYIYLGSFILSVIGFFNIMLLSSRATFLAIILSFVFLVMLLIIKFIKDRTNILSTNKTILILYVIPCIIAYFMSVRAIDPGPQGNVASRISTITSTSDVSKNTRLRYYSQSISHIMKNPILGAGIGNWKILSIKYDAENIQNYIIPYNAHNDILEATAETGIIGGLSFLLFYIVILYYLFQILITNLVSNDKYTYSLLLFIPFISYFIDLNLNFPSSRPANQFFLLMYICIIICFKIELNESK
tara:strand:+ start:682 stop:1899 length:1218 start_codon:yes stop_codon:yes gene_type:complete